MKVRVTDDSQFHMLRQAIEDADIKHNQEGRGVTVPLVRLKPDPFHPGQAIMYFCAVEKIHVEHISGPSDNFPIPLDVRLEGELNVRDLKGEEYFDLVNARIWPNGANHLYVERARLLPVGEAAEDWGG